MEKIEIIKFADFIFEAGKEGMEAGKVEFSQMTSKKAIEFFEDNNLDILSVVPNFEYNFELAKKRFALGHTKRKDMPRITKEDTLTLQQKLKSGELDVTKPFAPGTDVRNPFPEGLTGKEAEEWLSAGIHDGDKNDDKIKAVKTEVIIEKLKPIQEQVYFDQCVDFFFNYKSISAIYDFIADRHFLISSDYYLLDGHHRLGVGLILDPKLKAPALMIDMPIHDLLKLTLAYGDAVGNKRNK